MADCTKRCFAFLLVLTLMACGTAPKQAEDTAQTTDTETKSSIPDEVANGQRRAIDAMKNKQHKAAIGILSELVDLYPQYPGLGNNLGIAHVRLQQNDEAMQVFQKIVESHPQNAVAHNYIGILHRKQGRFDQARQSYQRAISADRTYSLAHLNLGILCDIYLQDLDCALKQYQAFEALEKNVDKQFKGWKVDLERRIKSGNR